MGTAALSRAAMSALFRRTLGGRRGRKNAQRGPRRFRGRLTLVEKFDAQACLAQAQRRQQADDTGANHDDVRHVVITCYGVSRSINDICVATGLGTML